MGKVPENIIELFGLVPLSDEEAEMVYRGMTTTYGE